MKERRRLLRGRAASGTTGAADPTLRCATVPSWPARLLSPMRSPSWFGLHRSFRRPIELGQYRCEGVMVLAFVLAYFGEPRRGLLVSGLTSTSCHFRVHLRRFIVFASHGVAQIVRVGPTCEAGELGVLAEVLEPLGLGGILEQGCQLGMTMCPGLLREHHIF